MAEDWRITGSVVDSRALVAQLHQEEADLPRIAVSRDGDQVFLYADTQQSAQAAQRIVERLEPGAEWQLSRWHHEEERWEDASVAMPSTPAAHHEEHEHLEEEETEESQESGLAAWEVRVEFQSHHAAHAFAEQEQREGRALTRRWKYVLVGFNDEDDANAFVKQLKGALPAGATLHVEPGSGLAWQLMPKNPFAVFGGLAE